jgi:integrase
MSLTYKQCLNAKAGRHSDGGGLYLLVKPSGARSWVLRVQYLGNRRDFGIGSFTDKSAGGSIPIERRKLLTLTEARDKAREGRKLAKAGINPSDAWRELELEERRKAHTFETVARDYHAHVSRSWRNGKHGKQWIKTLELYAFPKLGKKLVNDIDAPAMLSVLTDEWLTKGETMRRVKQRIGVVLDYAHGKGWRDSETPMRALNQLLRGLKQPGAGNFAAMPYADVPAFMGKLRAAEQSVGRLALKFTILTLARSGEVRSMKWKEIDFQEREWRLPPANTKMGRVHIVPLTGEAIAIVEQMQSLFGGDPDAFVFPGLKGKSLSDATLAKALRTTGGGDYTVHGFRSSFRDWAAETGQPDAWAEAALSHKIPDKVEAAYKRTTFYGHRRDELMPAWAAFVQGPSNLVSLAERRA